MRSRDFKYLDPLEGILKSYKIKKYVNGVEKEVDAKESILETDGSDMASILPLDMVDSTRTVSNDALDILKILGIEACRAVIMKEIRSVLNIYGIDVNYRHLAILIDVMT